MRALQRLSKFLHEIASAGLLGGVAAQLVFILLARREAPALAVVLRRAVVHLADWVLYPSVLALVFTGILSTYISRSLRNALWVWAKIGLGVPLVEVSLGPLRGGARDVAALLARTAAGKPDAEAMADALHREWAGLWMVVVLSAINIALAVWRPRILRTAPRSE